MSEFISSKGQPVVGRNLCFLCRLVVERLQEEGSHEPYESRGSRTELWGAGGEIPPVYPAQGATENHEICEELLSDMERRGLPLSRKTLWITDGGKGIIKALKERYAKKLLHQRCTIHKDRNIQKHLARFRTNNFSTCSWSATA